MPWYPLLSLARHIDAATAQLEAAVLSKSNLRIRKNRRRHVSQIQLSFLEQSQNTTWYTSGQIFAYLSNGNKFVVRKKWPIKVSTRIWCIIITNLHCYKHDLSAVCTQISEVSVTFSILLLLCSILLLFCRTKHLKNHHDLSKQSGIYLWAS